VANFTLFSNTGQNPKGGIIEGLNGKLYGLTNSGGAFGKGTLFQVDRNGRNYTALFAFRQGFGETPEFGKPIEISNCDVALLDSLIASASTLCQGDTLVLEVDTAAVLRASSQWVLHQDSLGNPIDSNSNGRFTLVPTQSAQYFVRGEGGCGAVEAQAVSISVQVTSINSQIIPINNYALQATDTTVNSYQWIDCDSMQAIPGATNREYVLSRNGNFAVVLSKSSCQDTSVCYSVIAVSVIKKSFGEELQLFPNPNQGQFTLRMPQDEQVDIRVLNLQGQVVMQQKAMHQEQLEVSLDGPSGIYFLEIQNESGERVLKKLIKH
jgi:hypothetical protein